MNIRHQSRKICCQFDVEMVFFISFSDNEFKEQGELVSIVQDLADGDTSSLGN